MRIYFIHVYRRHWEFYPDEHFDDAFGDESEGEQKSFIQWVKRTSISAWRSVETAESGVRGYMRRSLDTLNSRVDPNEPMLRRLFSAKTVEVMYPSGISQHYVRRRLRLLLLNKTTRHNRWMYINGALLPLTMAMTVIPGPNVFVAWNGYRLLSHLRAYRGGQRLLSGQLPVTYTPSDELNELLDPEERLSKPLDRTSAAHISEKFGLPGLVAYLQKTGSLPVE